MASIKRMPRRWGDWSWPARLVTSSALHGLGLPDNRQPMESWKSKMPKGMLLKSAGFASNLYPLAQVRASNVPRPASPALDIHRKAAKGSESSR